VEVIRNVKAQKEMKKKQPIAGDDAKQLTSEMEETSKGRSKVMQEAQRQCKKRKDGQSTNKSSSVQAGFNDRRVHLK
jgi:hypothetical protein